MKDNKPYVIINIDDLGMSKEVNMLTAGLMDEGRISSSTCLANGPCFEEAVSISKKFRNCSFGIHLNLTEFRPESGEEGLRPLLDRNGSFAGTVRYVKLTSAIRARIFKEWSAQIEKARKMGLEISHIDSHHHTHTMPELFFVLRALQKQYRIRRVRISRDLFHPELYWPPLRMRIFKKVYNTALRLGGGSTITVDALGSIDVFARRMREAGIRNGAIYEAMGHVDDDAEMPYLTSFEHSENLKKINLISYKDLS